MLQYRKAFFPEAMCRNKDDTSDVFMPVESFLSFRKQCRIQTAGFTQLEGTIYSGFLALNNKPGQQVTQTTTLQGKHFVYLNLFVGYDCVLYV